MRPLALLASLALIERLCGCTPATSPDAGPAPDPQPAVVYGELVEAGCLAPSPDGLSSVTAEHALHTTPWLECLFDGGSVVKCSVPCSIGN